ncbi:E3 ubiquitin-protein ligase HERC [Acrasis kona]|uniref:E3 ubiquitin-protein ligase HERC n=1 Tax=Acrasis kona TaxID=1008807 RepID=A0AAW2Z5C7_9EUKA
MTKVLLWGASIHKDERGTKIIEPKIIKGYSGVCVQACIGGNYVLVLNELGEVFSMGSGSGGRLGHGSTEDYKQFKKIGFGNSIIVSISAGDWNASAVDSLGNVYIWGKFGQDVLAPIKVEISELAVRSESGHQYTAILTDRDHLYFFGSNTDGKCGKKPSSTVEPYEFSLVELYPDEDDTFCDVSCGYHHTLVCSKKTGRVYSFGNNIDGQCGNGKKKTKSAPPSAVVLPEVQLLDQRITLILLLYLLMEKCLRGDAQLQKGSGYKHKLGNGSDKDELTPIKVDFFGNEIKAQKFVSGGIHSQVLDVNNNLYSFGCGSDGRLGHPEGEGHRYLYKEGVPKLIESIKGSVLHVDSGYYHVIAVCK